MPSEFDSVLRPPQAVPPSQRALEEAEILAEAARSLSRSLSLTEVAALVHALLGRILHADSFGVAVRDERSDELVLRYVAENGKVSTQGLRRPFNDGASEYLISTGEPLYLPRQATSELRNLGINPKGKECQSWMGVPLKARDLTIGAMILQDSSPNFAYSPPDFDFFCRMASATELGFRNCLLYEQIQESKGIAERRLTHLEGLFLEQEETLGRILNRLQISEERYRRLFEEAQVGFFLVDAEGKHLDVNPAGCRLIGYSREELLQMNLLDLIHEGERKNLALRFPLQAQRGIVKHFFSTFLRADGKEIQVELTISPVPTPSGSLFLFNMQDITEQLALQKRAEELFERYRTLFEHALFGMMVVQGHRVVAFNQEVLRLTGFTAEELTGKQVEELFSFRMAMDTPRHAQALAEEFPVPLQTEFEMTGKDDQSRIVEVYVSSIPWHDGRAYQVLLQDVTQRKQMEKHLFETQRMESIGVLAGGVAHEFNNLLTLILPNAQLIEREASEIPSVVRRAQTIQKTVSRANSLTRQLLAYAGWGSRPPVPMDVYAALKEIVGIIRESFGSSYTFELEQGPRVGKVAFDPAQLDQIILNLALNSRDAMPQGGTIRIRTSRKMIPEARGNPLAPTVDPLPEREWVQISFQDFGTGIPPEQLARIFDPFWTTKATDKGSGLGLSVVYGIVKAHQGELQAQSRLGKGTTILIQLPCCEPEPPPPRKPRGRPRKGSA